MSHLQHLFYIPSLTPTLPQNTVYSAHGNSYDKQTNFSIPCSKLHECCAGKARLMPNNGYARNAGSCSQPLHGGPTVVRTLDTGRRWLTYFFPRLREAPPVVVSLILLLPRDVETNSRSSCYVCVQNFR